MPLKVVFLDRGTLSPETVLKPLSFPHTLVCHERTAPEETAERIADADIVISNKVRIGRESLARTTRLKLIAVAATGYDVIDVPACSERGITVVNVRNYATNTVPEHTFALIFALRRSIVAYRQSVVDGRWQASGQFCYFDYPIEDLSGSTLGIIGSGALGGAVARIAEAIGMKVLHASRKGGRDIKPPYTPFDEVIRESDVITLHCPLVPATRHLIGAAEFASMKRSALLINTARGGLVDDKALCRAMREGQIGGAGFDVATEEPPPAAHTLMKLLDMPNFILTPHIGWASRQAIQSLADQLIGNIELFHAGTPRNVLT